MPKPLARKIMTNGDIALKAIIAIAIGGMVICLGHDIYKTQAREIEDVKKQIYKLPKDKNYDARARKIIDSYRSETSGDLINFAYKERKGLDGLYDLLGKK